MTVKRIWGIPNRPGDISGNTNVRYGSLVLICLLITLGVISRYGMGSVNPELFHLSSSIKNSGHYNVDPVAATLIPQSFPVFLKIFTGMYDIPFYHLLFGILSKFLIACGFLVLTWKLSYSVLSCFLAQIMLFGLSDFIILDLNIPLGFISVGIRKSLSFNFREIAMVFAIIATVFFLNGRYLLTSLILAFGFYIHPFNIMAFFVSFNVALVISFLGKEDKAEFIYAAAKLSIPFLVLVFPYLWMNAKMFSEITPISSSSWWKFILKNEPDDASLLFYITRGGLIKEAFLTIVAAVLYMLLKSEKPVTKDSLKALIGDKQDSVVPLLVAPWAAALFAAVWESTFIDRTPDFLNDIFIPLQFRRLTIVSAFLYITILAAFISRLVLVLTEISLAELFGWQQFAEGESNSEKRFPMFSLDVLFGVGLSVFLVIFVLVRSSSKGVDLQKYWNLEHVGYDYFPSKCKDTVVYQVGDNSSNAKIIPLLPFVDVSNFIRNSTPVASAFFHPTYVPCFRIYSERQGFLCEHLDGGYALYNRKFATIYLKRFSDIHKGLTYNDLPGIVFNGGEGYAIMRQRYLSLDESDIERLKILYPGYKYFLTEVGHALPYRRIYANNYFLLYDLEQKETTQ